mmetsp:Transcript_11304/g.15666  ORF Transcript_11304/g.15666 Transcript_11304/m.15666 type:complete len:214 (-) Transcript_11304:390-1031(-)
MVNNDDKYAKSKAQNGLMVRQITFYMLLFSYIADVFASKAETMMHLTMWSWFLHTLYFQLHLPSHPGLVRLLHGPSFAGAHALFGMYCWTLLVNPSMEFDLAPEGRARWVTVLRAFWLHAAPVFMHRIDTMNQIEILRNAYRGHDTVLLQLWASVCGYFAMGLTWEQVNGDASGTYNVTRVSPEVFVAVSKVVGVGACIMCFFLFTRPSLIKC